MRRVCGGPRHQVLVGRRVPEPDAGGQPNGPAARVPGCVRNRHVDLAAGGRDGHPRGRRDGLARGGGDQVGVGAVNGEEEAGRGRGVRPVWELARLRRSADRDRRPHELRVLHRVERDAECGRGGLRLDAKLDQVGRVVGVDRSRRVRVGPVRPREAVACGPRVSRIGRGRLRAVVVIEVVLVKELAVAIGAGPGDEDRVRVPDARVLELRGLGRGAIEDVRSRARSRTVVEGRARREAGGSQDERHRSQQDADLHPQPTHAAER